MSRLAFNLGVLHVIAHTLVHALGASSLSQRRILLSLLQLSLCAFAREQTCLLTSLGICIVYNIRQKQTESN